MIVSFVQTIIVHLYTPLFIQWTTRKLCNVVYSLIPRPGPGNEAIWYTTVPPSMQQNMRAGK